MKNERAALMNLLFDPEAFGRVIQQASAYEAMRQEAIRASALGIMALANFRAFALRELVVSPHEVIESFAQLGRPVLEAAAAHHLQQSVAGRFFAEQKLNWKPHPAVTRLIRQLRSEMRAQRAQSEPQQLDTIG